MQAALQSSGTVNQKNENIHKWRGWWVRRRWYAKLNIHYRKHWTHLRKILGFYHMPIVNSLSSIIQCSSSQRCLGSCLNWKSAGRHLRHKHPWCRGTSLWQMTSAALSCSYKLHFTLPSVTPVQLPPYFQIHSGRTSYCQLAFFSQVWSPKFHFKAVTGTHVTYKKSIVKLFQICSHALHYSKVPAF